jgi:neutral ceramidase
VVRTARKEAHALCGIPPENCFVAATHTHSGGPIFGGFLSVPDSSYPDFVACQIGAAIAEAFRRRRPVHAGTGAGRAEGIAFNRRFFMKDGSQITHPGKMNPGILEAAGPEDPTVTVIGFCDPATWLPVGAVISFACHATHMNGYLYSADYPKWIADTLRAVYGPDFEVVFLNGACGDVTQVDNRQDRAEEFGPWWAERTGRAVAGAAIQALSRMTWRRHAPLRPATAFLRAAIRESAAADRKAARALLKKTPVSAENVDTIYARELLEVEKMRKEKPRRRLEISAISIGDTVFWGVPGEYFQEFALDVRAESPFAHTCCIELANGYNGYICTEESFQGGGYEIRTARSSFLVPETGRRIARRAAKLCNDLYAMQKKAVARYEKNAVWPAYHDPGALDGINQLKNGDCI